MPERLAVDGQGVLVRYDHRTALDTSDFVVPRGSLTAVIGPNGSGKSTLLGAISGLTPLSRGRIEVLGSPAGRNRHLVAYVLQATTVNRLMPVTVAEVVAMGRFPSVGFLRPMRRTDRQAVTRAMERLDILDLGGRHLTELSGGQRQRVFVAQGLAQEADLLLLDEPTTGLDIPSREAIRQAIEEELAKGTTVVLTTHEVAEAAEADHVLLMSGRVHTSAPPAEALTPERLTEAYGIGIVHLEDGSVVLDDAAHGSKAGRHVHFERGDS